MEIIPVIDLMNGRAVQAKRGLREQYRPLRSPLCGGSAPIGVLEGLLSLHPFKTVYLADLDALMGKGLQASAIDALIDAFPAVGFWIDSGLPQREGSGFLAAGRRTTAVIGSESLEGKWRELANAPPGSFILSLDFLGGELLGPKPLLDHPELWPERVIVMSLSHVGGEEGPDFARLEELVRRHPRQRFVAAGGVRDAGDIERIEALGVSQALLASALHSGKVDRRVLGRLA